MKLKEINLMNVFMCFCVVAIHLTSSLVTSLSHESDWYSFFFVINKALTFAVPAFLFLSGFKLFNKYKDIDIDLKKFYLGRAKKVLLPYIICFLVYFAYYLFKDLTKWDEFLSGLFLGTLVAHFYYIIVAVQFYLLFPILLKMFKKHEIALLVLSFVCTIIFNQFVSFEYADRTFVTYLFYFILGMFVSNHKKEDESTNSLILKIICFSAIFIPHMMLSYKMSLGDYWYRISGGVQVLYNTTSILLVYSICKLVKNAKVDKIVDFINPHTYIIFLYHIFIIHVLQFSVYPHFNLNLKYQFLISTIVVFGSVLIYCFIANRIKQRGAKND